MYIPPWTIVAGLGALSRDELCQLIPLFDDATPANLAIDAARDLSSKIQRSAHHGADRAFQKRVAASAKHMKASDISDAALQARLWDQLGMSLDLPAVLPLSARTANALAAELGHRAAQVVARNEKEDWAAFERSKLPAALLTKVKARFSAPRVDFSSIVVTQAELVAQAIADNVDALDIRAREKLVTGIKDYLNAMPVELRDKATQDVAAGNDAALIKLMATGTSLVGVGVAVKMAGFSAYILAAQASAVIPFVTGPMLVSGLFVLANPLFIGASLLGAAYLASKGVGAGRSRLAANLVVQLALRGISSERDGLANALNAFKSLRPSDLASLPAARRRAIDLAIEDIHVILERPEATPGMPPEAIARREDKGHSALDAIFFGQKDAREAFVVGGLTLGDVLYDAVAIDPAVLRAADFSRTEDLENVFDFGAFAHRASEMAEAAAAGVGNNLRGYVAEQIVAAKLVEAGHVVGLPETANNAGFDLLVDGHPFQVKCLASLSGLEEHFSKYPDLPVYANSELAVEIASLAPEWASKVFFLDGYDRELTDFVMQAALDSGAQLHDLDVPFFAVAVSSARNAISWWKGKIPLSDLPFSVALDGTIAGGLAAVGGISGQVLGLAIFGPAGALVFGGVGGAGALLAKSWTREQMTKAVSSQWLGEIREAVERFKESLSRAIFVKMGLWKQKVAQSEGPVGPEAAWFIAKMSDEVLSLAEQSAALGKVAVSGRELDAAHECLRIMKESSVHPLSVQAELEDLLAKIAERPTLTALAGRGVELTKVAIKKNVGRVKSG